MKSISHIKEASYGLKTDKNIFYFYRDQIRKKNRMKLIFFKFYKACKHILHLFEKNDFPFFVFFLSISMEGFVEVPLRRWTHSDLIPIENWHLRTYVSTTLFSSFIFHSFNLIIEILFGWGLRLITN